jgi:hypothetical protein
MPYAVEVDTQVITLYDPVVHKRIETVDAEIDPRWILCKRPYIMVGGELVPAMLELRLDEASGIYSAPLQMKANNGIFVIDDFGRQHISPRELLNLWIVTLDRRVDYLSLRYGLKFEIPFQVLVVFATNLTPSELADEAFLRRIHNKIYVDPVSPDAFDEIFRRVARSRLVTVNPESFAAFRDLCLADGRSELRALSQRRLQDSELDRALREPRSGGDASGPGARRAAVLHVGIEKATPQPPAVVSLSWRQACDYPRIKLPT